MIVAVEVGVALSRPPRLDRLSRVLVDVPFNPLTDSWFAAEVEAQLIAIDIAASRRDVVMPVSAKLTDIIEI